MPLPDQVDELALTVDVFVATVVSTAVIRAAVAAAPIVTVDLLSEPLTAAFAATYARPRGDATGLFLDLAELAGGQLRLLREALPGLRRVAVL